MKIFAKRKRSKEVEKDDGKTLQQQQDDDDDGLNKTFESDEIVKELLQQDPSTWNAKHRRLIKRYNERNSINVNPNNGSSNNVGAAVQSLSVSTIEQSNSILGTATSSIDDLTQQNTLNLNSTQDEDEEEDEQENDEDEDDVDNKHDNNNNNDDDEEEIHEEDEEEKDVTNDDELNKIGHPLDIEDATPNDKEIIKGNIKGMNATTTESSASVKGDIDTKLKEMLDQLNSKQRRTLVRQYDRDGNLEQLRNETIRLLDENEKTKLELEAQKKKAEEEEEKEEEIEEPVKKKARRRKPVVDESKLSPEERIRREEQRRIQAIARMNQANINSDDQQQHESSSSTQVKSKHRHPLNSERRRANRRKPKWESIKKGGTPNEHHTSGYYMRKVTKNEI